MKKIFWIGVLGLLLFEAANVYFIMPMPGSQQSNSINLAYFLYEWRWIFRIVFGLLLIIGLLKSNWKRKWVPFIPIAIAAVVVYMANFVMAADHMFYQPQKYLLADAAHNKIDSARLVLGVVENNQPKAYPIQLIGYHHQVQDTIGGKPVLITYCTVCRTGRVYEPIVNGKQEIFRLVGMDHFNAMLEDATTKSWWRQVTGEAITGKLKGQKLPEVLSTQTTLSEWLKLYPSSLVMQPDPSFVSSYDTTFRYESGKSKSKLTGTDSLSWKNKSWVVGITADNISKAYDWNRLKEERIIRDKIGYKTILIILADDNKSFFAYELPSADNIVSITGDTIVINNSRYRLDGRGVDAPVGLKQINASQEFWHSWKTFHPETLKY
ncbi:MAG: DUF3179 domain-containing protein [Sphingobacteriales bacterium]|nr:DUF3179 domain-containing protein [Sphingobacteriales bacterium]MBI3718906.1 DUF3179 domain-containing protein [Sphingobacteriales bacterium]